MIIKKIIDEDFSNYKKPSMLVAFPHCSFKCDKECNQRVCHNSTLSIMNNVYTTMEKTITRYLNNKLTDAIVIGGLEPMDDYIQLYRLIKGIRKNTEDDIVIYTGYYRSEVLKEIEELSQFKNIIVKFGRFIPGYKNHFDEVLGVELASDNQYAERIS